MAKLPDNPEIIDKFWRGCGYSPDQVAAGIAPNLGAKLCEFMGVPAPYELSSGAMAFAGAISIEGAAA